MNTEGHLTANEMESQSNTGPSNKQTNKNLVELRQEGEWLRSICWFLPRILCFG